MDRSNKRADADPRGTGNPEGRDGDRPSGESRILLTGRPGIGKTTVVRRVVERLARGEAEGFVTEEIRGTDGGRTGFRIRTLAGETGTLARAGMPSRIRIGRYGVDLAEIERVVIPSIEAALASGALVVLDEVGKMESACEGFRRIVERVFASRARILATVPIHAHPWIDSLKRRPDVRLVEVTHANREGLPQRLLDRLR